MLVCGSRLSAEPANFPVQQLQLQLQQQEEGGRQDIPRRKSWTVGKSSGSREHLLCLVRDIVLVDGQSLTTTDTQHLADGREHKVKCGCRMWFPAEYAGILDACVMKEEGSGVFMQRQTEYAQDRWMRKRRRERCGQRGAGGEPRLIAGWERVELFGQEPEGKYLHVHRPPGRKMKK